MEMRRTEFLDPLIAALIPVFSIDLEIIDEFWLLIFFTDFDKTV